MNPSEGPAAPKAGKAKATKRFEIKKWNAVAMWSWAICTDTCAICRNNLYEPSIEYQVRHSCSRQLSQSQAPCSGSSWCRPTPRETPTTQA